MEGLRYESRRPHRSPHRVHGNLVLRILQLRRKHPAWGAMRIHAVLARRSVRVNWRTVHRVLKRHGFMVRVVRKPQPFKRFQLHHVDSLSQMDIYEFRIGGSEGQGLRPHHPRRPVALPGMACGYRRERAHEAINNL